MTNSATEAERAQAAEIAAFKHWMSTLHPDAVPQPWDAWQAARAIPLAAAEPVGCPKCGCTGLHACPGSPMAEWTPEKIAELHAVLDEYETPAAPDRAPSTDADAVADALAKVSELGTVGAMKWLVANLPGRAPSTDSTLCGCGKTPEWCGANYCPDDAPSTDSATERDAKARRLLKAASVYAFNYCQDEAEDEEDCVCGAKQHAEAKELFAAIAAMKGEEP